MLRGFIILDFGSQFTQLIARRLREMGYYSEIHSYKYPTEEIIKKNPYGIILSGGPNSVYEPGAPQRNIQELRSISPLFCVCYGMQLLTHSLGGKVTKAQHREYGLNYVTWTDVVKGVPQKQKVWMSHGDVVETPPEGFKVIANSDGDHPAAIRGENVLAVQFHPEVAHTEHGLDLLKHFTADMCKAPADWDAPHIKDHLMEDIRKKVAPEDHVLVGLSGGVDSTVVATLLTKALGADRVHCVFVDNGLLRKNEYETVLKNYEGLGLNVRGVDASQEFMSALAGKTDPEDKRKAIGRVFIEVFDKSYDKSLPIKWLAQGTLYPDVIESVSSIGGSVTIKSHHNVGGLPEKMNLKLLEPVRELFKDEVRAMGAQLGLAHDLLWRHPFPGPGLAIRVLGEVTPEKLRILKDADDVYISQLRKHGLYEKIWQAFCVLLPVKTVGVQGDSRTYDHVLALRAVTSSDGMTADWYPFEFAFLREVSNLITNKVKGVNRVVYDVTSKPPGTIEWE
ncbi:glutamine-hydrolyzing GMP synthase [Bdellovibrio sp. HCB209]|uniref:glutamine-hydrolyzing GMP synthase n=1 Tax=Bdellovibrio sp. HCB209 TaxID=3394354 RepID=UPI0039B56FD9